MSHVTTMIVHVGILEDVGVKALENWEQPDREFLFKRFDQVDEAWGGGKFPQVHVFSGAFNYLDWDTFKTFIESVPWEYPDDLQVLANGENDSRFGLWELRSGVLTHIAGDAHDYGL